jgi:WD40 repeat protein
MKPTVFYTLFLGIFLVHNGFGQVPELVIPSAHSGSVYYLTEHPVKKLLLSEDGEKTTKIWDIRSRKLLYTYSNQRIKISPTGTYIIADSVYGSARIYELASGKEIFYNPSGRFCKVAFSNKNDLIAQVYGDSLVVRDLKTSRVKRVIKGYFYNSFFPEFSTDDRFIMYAVNISTENIPPLQIMDIESGNMVATFLGLERLKSFSFVNNNQSVVFQFEDYFQCVEISSKQLLFNSGKLKESQSLVIDQSGKKITAVTAEGTLKIWDLLTGKEIFKLALPANEIRKKDINDQLHEIAFVLSKK